ncbi:hypothetical protein BGZ82_001193 [Podila clonocystis]|nr:hypothetical protein BGZ82_001193 [Podila clonocystis]
MDLTELDQAGPLTQGAILSTCEHYLQEIGLDSTCGYSSKPLQALLCRASNLQKLATYIYVWNDDLFIYGTDMIESPWATTVLRSFRCPINVPRSYNIKEGGERIYSADGPGVERSREIQRRVLQHLGAQTELEQLHLGCNMDSYDEYQAVHEDDIPEYQWNSLELTLAGGLDELAGLKKLRMLGVDFTVMA